MGKDFTQQPQRKFWISCDECQSICNQHAYYEGNFMGKVKKAWHQLFCKACREYSSLNKHLNAMINSEKVHHLTPEQKAQMQAIFDEARN